MERLAGILNLLFYQWAAACGLVLKWLGAIGGFSEHGEG